MVRSTIMNINHKQVSKLNSFNGVKLRGNETFDELLEIEKNRKEQIALDNANIQRVDAQIKLPKQFVKDFKKFLKNK